MSLFEQAKRLGALAFALGAALAGPVVPGVASAAPEASPTKDSAVTPTLVPKVLEEPAVNTASVRPAVTPTASPVAPVMLGQTDDGRIIGFLVATDPDSGDVSYTLAQSPRHGAIQLDDSGLWTYTPGVDFEGADSFYVIMDDPGPDLNPPHVFSNSALVSVDITVPDLS
jgi:hypothetical protein